jgi:hypothetical protein
MAKLKDERTSEDIEDTRAPNKKFIARLTLEDHAEVDKLCAVYGFTRSEFVLKAAVLLRENSLTKEERDFHAANTDLFDALIKSLTNSSKALKDKNAALKNAYKIMKQCGAPKLAYSQARSIAVPPSKILVIKGLKKEAEEIKKKDISKVSSVKEIEHLIEEIIAEARSISSKNHSLNALSKGKVHTFFENYDGFEKCLNSYGADETVIDSLIARVNLWLINEDDQG